MKLIHSIQQAILKPIQCKLMKMNGWIHALAASMPMEPITTEQHRLAYKIISLRQQARSVVIVRMITENTQMIRQIIRSLSWVYQKTDEQSTVQSSQDLETLTQLALSMSVMECLSPHLEQIIKFMVILQRYIILTSLDAMDPEMLQMQTQKSNYVPRMEGCVTQKQRYMA